MTPGSSPLTVGTAGHIDHGKTALVRSLTGVETDRLPEERARGITIVLGYAPLVLPSGRRLSLVDVPGHDRLVRVMVAGATGIDLFLLAVAADDGVMPQTVEHARVLAALGVERGVVAVTKSDLADPAPAAAQAAELLPAAEVVACSVRNGSGVGDVAAALERVAGEIDVLASGAALGEAVLHIDRVFTIRGAGTVVTGTLWSGEIRRGDGLRVLPSGHRVRVRAVQVHDQPADAAPAGQRVAVNLTGIGRGDVTAGDVLAAGGAPVQVSYRVEARVALDEPLEDREGVWVHHGTRAVRARALALGDGVWQLRLEHPLLAADGDRLVLRRINPPDTLGGGVIVRARAGGRRAEPPPPPVVSAAPRAAPLDVDALALEARLRDAGHEPLSLSELGVSVGDLAPLIERQRVVRVGRSMYAHRDAIAHVRAVVAQLIDAEGVVTLARLRDELGTSRKYAQALLEHLDGARVTRRRPDDSRVLRHEPAG